MCVVGGRELNDWFFEYDNCNPNGTRTGWPNGKSYSEQENILVAIWSIISSELNKHRENVERNRIHNKRNR